jgi:hypothetical protein
VVELRMEIADCGRDARMVCECENRDMAET